jgi:hypothetical protein
MSGIRVGVGIGDVVVHRSVVSALKGQVKLDACIPRDDRPGPNHVAQRHANRGRQGLPPGGNRHLQLRDTRHDPHASHAVVGKEKLPAVEATAEARCGGIGRIALQERVRHTFRSRLLRWLHADPPHHRFRLSRDEVSSQRVDARILEEQGRGHRVLDADFPEGSAELVSEFQHEDGVHAIAVQASPAVEAVQRHLQRPRNQALDPRPTLIQQHPGHQLPL